MADLVRQNSDFWNFFPFILSIKSWNKLTSRKYFSIFKNKRDRVNIL